MGMPDGRRSWSKYSCVGGEYSGSLGRPDLRPNERLVARGSSGGELDQLARKEEFWIRVARAPVHLPDGA
jgi:hypothetical protein